jgi:HlyD family secretion protein
MLIPEVHVDVDERDLSKVAVGQEAVLVTDAYPDRSVDAEVVEIGPRADPERGVIQVTVHPTQEVEWLRAGMTTDATIIIAPPSSELVIPTTAIMRGDDGVYVFVVDSGVIRRIDVEVGHSRKEGTVVLSGLAEDSTVVVNPLKTEEGAEVRTRTAGDGDGV